MSFWQSSTTTWRRSATFAVKARSPLTSRSSRGEWSFVFFDRQYSHAVLKRAAAGEFRVHIEWGGTVESAVAPPALVRDAQQVVDRLDLQVAYARVDGTDVGGRLMLMELELIEPELFLDHHPDAAARLATSVLRQLTRP